MLAPGILTSSLILLVRVHPVVKLPAPDCSMQDLYNQEPWLRGLSTKDIAKMQAQGEVARNGGK
jgi:hypothetical protein